jgi:hypothetical protein
VGATISRACHIDRSEGSLALKGESDVSRRST